MSNSVYEDYNVIVPVYERTSSAITLGMIGRWRRITIRLGLMHAKRLWRILDAGSGPGSMTMELLRQGASPGIIVMLDLSIPMLKAIPRELNADLVCGMFERAPFRDGVFDMVIMGFSLHTTDNPHAAFRELSRIMADGGVLAAVSIGKPRNTLIRLLGGLYTRLAIPIITLVSAGPRYIKYFSDIHKIYSKLPPNDEFRAAANGYLTSVKAIDAALGMVNITIMVKGWAHAN